MKFQIRSQTLSYEDLVRVPSLKTGTVDSKRKEILDYFNQSYDLYETAFELLATEKAYYIPPIPVRRPLIFYLGHTASFYINKLKLMNLIQQGVNSELESMFAVGVDEMPGQDMNDGHFAWPSVAEVRAFREKVRAVVTRYIQHELPLAMPIKWEDPAWTVLMTIEHEKVHLETSLMLIRELPLELVTSSPNWPTCTDRGHSHIVHHTMSFKGGTVHIGKSKDADYFGWDNEYDSLEVDVQPFEANHCLTSNGDFLEFERDDGYFDPQWWSAEGWAWRNSNKQQTKPHFWCGDTPPYRLRVLAEEVPLPWDWPVEVNVHEAKAYCNWLSAKSTRPVRLMTEAEWHCMALQLPNPFYPSWPEATSNIDMAHWASPCPVHTFKHGHMYDIMGNVWQWCEDKSYPLNGFEPHPAYMDYSSPTFDGKHNILKGGCWASTGSSALPWYRNMYRPHFLPAAGFRCVFTPTDLTIC